MPSGSRRTFLKNAAFSSLALGLGNTLSLQAGSRPDFISKRPPVKDRKFISPAIEQLLVQTKARIRNPELAWMFDNCFPNTLDTTVTYHKAGAQPDTFIITGDIPQMWLRDSTAQVFPYLKPAKQDPALQTLIAGLIHRQASNVLLDPYANAFLLTTSEESEHKTDETDMKPGVFERKWEVDSLCYTIRLSYHFWKETGNTAPFDDNWKQAMRLIVKTFQEQQRKNGAGPYSFKRKTSYSPDTAQGDGTGKPVRPVGLIASAFRPSDDGTIFPFLVPSNFFAVTTLRQLAEMSVALHNDTGFAAACTALADEVSAALQQHAIVTHPVFGKLYAYEVDGFGSTLLMDDANIPSLISLPYIAGIPLQDEIYQNTRRFCLSNYNPYYAEGVYKGVGGPHTGREMIWPLTYIVQALTTADNNEKRSCLELLLKTHAGTGFIHESFYKNDPKKFTRSWFAWANTLFGELVLESATAGLLK